MNTVTEFQFATHIWLSDHSNHHKRKLMKSNISHYLPCVWCSIARQCIIFSFKSPTKIIWLIVSFPNYPVCKIYYFSFLFYLRTYLWRAPQATGLVVETEKVATGMELISDECHMLILSFNSTFLSSSIILYVVPKNHFKKTKIILPWKY